MTAPKYVEAWWAFVDENGQQVSKGGRTLGIGIDADGQLWLCGQLIDPPVPMSPELAARLADRITKLLAGPGEIPEMEGDQSA